jgi:DNA-binding LacI/PurR family transcriptional regulator
LKQELETHMPLAVLDSSFSIESGVRVVSDDSQGVREAVEYLMGLGHRRIGFITVRGDGAAHWREECFLDVMLSKGIKIPSELIVDGKGFWNAGDVEIAVNQLFSVDPTPTAVIAAGDAIAMTALRVLRRRGLRVPEDVSVIGFSDLIMASHADPPLTTVAQPFREMGAVAVRHLLDEIQRRRHDASPLLVESLLPTHLLIRESCGPCSR